MAPGQAEIFGNLAETSENSRIVPGRRLIW
jgi:hypothetical protein